MKLYRVTLRGMYYATTGTNYGTPYVIAEDPTSAYEMVKAYLDKEGLGFSHERELDKIELLAETGDYPECKEQLYLGKEK